nr:YeeE/YedE family protein [Clostridia bacterium]
MNAYLIPGLLGLMTGLVLHWGMLSRADGLRAALGIRRSLPLRTSLTALGWGTMMTALLMWLAVLDVDRVHVLPLAPGALLGGALFGVCAALCGFTPATAFAGLGAGNALESLCVIAGCFVGTALSPALDGLLAPLHSPWLEATLFRVTLDKPWLLTGSFLGLGCLGALLAAWGMCIPSPRPALLSDEVIAERAAEVLAPAEEEPSPDPESAAAGTVIAALEGEEPLIVDTALDDQTDDAEADDSEDEEDPED